MVLSHRGFWLTRDEQNTEAAFARSFAAGFGVETDVRDASGELVISHDPPNGGEMTFTAFLNLYASLGKEVPLALNIKADGLHLRLRDEIARLGASPHFFFDMSVPDAIGYVRHGLPIYTRESEHEPEPALYEHAVGVWLDCFDSDWIEAKDVRRHLDAGKAVCLVSPELHGRPHAAFWQRLVDARLHRASNLAICTDHPQAAREFFNAAD